MNPKPVEERLDALEKELRYMRATVDMTINYVRAIAQAHLTPAQIHAIESAAGNGHDADAAP